MVKIEITLEEHNDGMSTRLRKEPIGQTVGEHVLATAILQMIKLVVSPYDEQKEAANAGEAKSD